MQRHPSQASNIMQAKMQKLLSSKANKSIIAASTVAQSVSRAARGLARLDGAHATSIITLTTLRPAMLRRLAAYKNIARVGLSGLSTAFAMHFATHDVSSRVRRDVPPVLEPLRVTVEDHWNRATGIITAALASFQHVKSLHASAAAKLDSADYALTQLLHDLRPVMGLPADVSGLRAVLVEAERTAPERLRKALAA